MFYMYYDRIKNKYFEECCMLSPIKREAFLFRKTCEEIPLTIKDTDLIPGRYGSETEDKTGEAENRSFASQDMFTEEERMLEKQLRSGFGLRTHFDRGHTCIDYEAIINHGLISYEKRILEEQAKESGDEQKAELLEGMLSALESVKVYTARFAEIAETLYQQSRNDTYLKMKKTMQKVPYLPCEDFYEAICAVWIMHSLIPISDHSWASISLGKLDRYLYPFYQQSLQKGETREEIKKYLIQLFDYLNLYGDGACALNVGGMDADGQDLTNELTYLIIEVEKEVRMASPILAVRINPLTPEKLFDEVINYSLFCIGQPTFYGELPCRNAVEKRGVPKQDAWKYSVNSCMGLYMSGEEIASMWGCVFNMHLPLELAVNAGKPLFEELPYESQVRMQQEPENLGLLLESYGCYLKELFGLLYRFNRKNALNCALNKPNPLLSALTKGCIESGKDRAIGAKYNTETVETMALVNTADAICAIDTLVYRTKKYTLKQYVEAVKHHFVGYEEIRKDIAGCEKYGTNSSYADGITKRLCEIVWEICKELSSDQVSFLPSLHTLDSNVSFGEQLYPTLDARPAGKPVAKNAGPTNEVRKPDPTSMILSAASIPQELFSGGQPIDLYFDRQMFETKEKRDHIKTLIKTYFDLGGLQLQVNSIDLESLEKAYDNPEEYPHLVVRIGGYSMQFTSLQKASQREFIERFRREQQV